MTILFAGGEDTSFTLRGAVTAVSTVIASVVRSTFARAVFQTNPTTGDPPVERISSPTFTATSTLWLHAMIGQQTANQVTVANQQVIRVLDGATCRLIVRGTGTNGLLKISTRTAGGTITDLVTSATNILTGMGTLPMQLDLAIVYGTSGSVTLYANGLNVATYSGDITTDGATTLNNFELAAHQSANYIYWSEIIAADEDTRSMALWTLPPVAAGNTQVWSPNTLANINKTVINDVTSISTATNNALSEWTRPIAIPSGTWSVKAIVQSVRVQVAASGPQHFDWVVRTAATDYLAGASQTPMTSFSNFQRQWPINPNTSAPWQVSEIIAAGFNLGIQALA